MIKLILKKKKSTIASRNCSTQRKGLLNPRFRIRDNRDMTLLCGLWFGEIDSVGLLWRRFRCMYMNMSMIFWCASFVGQVLSTKYGTNHFRENRTCTNSMESDLPNSPSESFYKIILQSVGSWEKNRTLKQWKLKQFPVHNIWDHVSARLPIIGVYSRGPIELLTNNGFHIC